MKPDVESAFSSHQQSKHVVPSIGTNWREHAAQQYLLKTFIIIFIIILLTSVAVVIIIADITMNDTVKRMNATLFRIGIYYIGIRNLSIW